MGDFLIAALVDFETGAIDPDQAQRVSNSMMLGSGAGNVLHSHAEGAFLARREPEKRQARQSRTAALTSPVTKHEAGYYPLFAGHLHNREEMCQALNLAPTIGDAMLYAAAYARFGEACDERLLGDYAALIWDPEKRRLRCAVSPMSMHPLHVYRSKNRLVIASNPRMIFATGVASHINEDKLADTLLVNFNDTTQSWYAGLSRIAPGTIETHDPHCHKARRFWSVRDIAPTRFKRDADYVEAVREQLDRAVAASMQGAQQPAIQLSGGLDSSAIASSAMRRLPQGQPLRSYSWVPVAEHKPEPRAHLFDDESAHIQALADMYPALQPAFLTEPDAEFGQYYDRMFMLGGWPNYAYLSWTNALYQRANDDGCDVILNGYFGNAAFSRDGRTAFPTWLRTGKWARLVHELGASEKKRPFWRKLFSLALRPNLPLSAQEWLAKRQGRYHSAFEYWCPLREDFARENGALDRAAHAGVDVNFQPVHSARDDLATYISLHEADTAQVHQGIRLAHGIEIRTPLSYRPLVELMAGIPEDQFLRDGVHRWLPRRVLEGRVPDMIRLETRTGNDTADWPIHFRKHRTALLLEIEHLADNPRMARIFDTERLHRDLTQWDGGNALASFSEHKIPAGVGRAIRAARFIRFVEGTNDV